MSKIKEVRAREILDSRGNPTIEVRVTLDDHISAKAAVPSGASTGVHEALELRDADPQRYQGKGVLKACQNVNEIIAREIVGQEPDPRAIDQKMLEMDSTPNKSKLGANAILGVSLAVARVAAKAENFPLYLYLRKYYQFDVSGEYKFPYPMVNLINGGRHADNELDVQESMIIPLQTTFKQRMETAAKINSVLRQILNQKQLSSAVGDEGGFAPRLKTNEQALELLLEAIKKAGLSAGQEVAIALDVAASEFYSREKSQYFFEGKGFSADQMIQLYRDWQAKYPLTLIEDGLSEDDWDNWSKLLEWGQAKNLVIMGDDLLTTSIERLKKGIEIKSINSILVKPNQVGTLSETIDCIKVAQQNNIKVAISHRSGETSDEFIADLAVAVGADYLKAGAPARGERVAKYNRVMEIEEEFHRS